MFERYTEKARRAIFFARYEASQYGNKTIETEHLLLGLFREDLAFARKFLGEKGGTQALRDEIESHITRGERISTSVEVPLSVECKRVLNRAAEEAQRLGSKHIGTEHLLLGIFHEPECLAARLLHNRGLKLEETRDAIARSSDPPMTGAAEGIASVHPFVLPRAICGLVHRASATPQNAFSLCPVGPTPRETSKTFNSWEARPSCSVLPG